ncbi:RNA polymerase sporulation sigma factor SigH [Halanaerobium praevalens]|uniref:RNA polymerase, sigma-24 subunit, ECF subfamily n=1 Tax=Halanaerobium praevalens (strain ATCC 33744 / DSM 2228 / GSL) TaxID=572479 RepID=E3DR54_HALPG|nr:RNA polymerase sporulation sigma factor SigH [Halanaerobium praevalens]ADO78043.1 RNA polymerase, sigma-24 subunit, ECF subfamily [Halanaerobium praevalens DSM 2228]
MFKEKEEAEIIQMAQAGNDFAIEYLINQNMDIVYAKSRFFFIKGLDHDDVIQEGRVGLYKAIRDFRAEKGASFRGFSQLCVHRQLISAIKKANRQKHVPLNTSASLDKSLDYGSESGRTFNEILPDEGENLEKKFICQETLSTIIGELSEDLTDLEWNAFMLYLDCKSYQEISDQLDINVKTVDNALQRARKKIDDLRQHYNLKGVVN